MWYALSDGAFTFTDDDDPTRTETIDTEENPIMFGTLIGIFAIIGGVGIRLLLTKEKEEETLFEDEAGRFQWSSAPYYKTAFGEFILSYFGMGYLIVMVICIYFSDFSTNRTRLIMTSILSIVILVKIFVITLDTPRQIKEENEGLLIKRWLFRDRFIPFSQIEKHTINDKRISIWFSGHKQVAFTRGIIEEAAASALKRTLKKHAN